MTVYKLAKERLSYDNDCVKTLTFDQAQAQFEKVFQLAAAGETVVIHKDGQSVALRSLTDEDDVAPQNYFADDYSRGEIAELNRLASQAPKNPLP